MLLGVTHNDGWVDVEWMVDNIRDLRILHEEKSVADLGTPVLAYARRARSAEWALGRPAGGPNGQRRPVTVLLDTRD